MERLVSVSRNVSVKQTVATKSISQGRGTHSECDISPPDFKSIHFIITDDTVRNVSFDIVKPESITESHRI